MSAPRTAPDHGSYGGYIRHKRARETPCAACVRANAAYQRAWRQRGKCAPGLGWPLEDPAMEAIRAD